MGRDITDVIVRDALAEVRREAAAREESMRLRRLCDEAVEAMRMAEQRQRLIDEEWMRNERITVALGPGQEHIVVCPSCIGRGCEMCDDMGVVS